MVERWLAGLDVDQVVDVIGKGAAQSWQMDNRAATMAAGEFDFGFAVEWMRKDLGICFDEADRNGAELPVAAVVVPRGVDADQEEAAEGEEGTEAEGEEGGDGAAEA